MNGKCCSTVEPQSFFLAFRFAAISTKALSTLSSPSRGGGGVSVQMPLNVILRILSAIKSSLWSNPRTNDPKRRPIDAGLRVMRQKTQLRLTQRLGRRIAAAQMLMKRARGETRGGVFHGP